MSDKPSSERLIVDADDALTAVFQRLNQIEKESGDAQSRLADQEKELAEIACTLEGEIKANEILTDKFAVYEAAEKGAHDRAIGVEMNRATWVDKKYYDTLRVAYAAVVVTKEAALRELSRREIELAAYEQAAKGAPEYPWVDTYGPDLNGNLHRVVSVSNYDTLRAAYIAVVVESQSRLAEAQAGLAQVRLDKDEYDTLKAKLKRYKAAEEGAPEEPERRPISFDGFKSVENLVRESDYNKLRAFAIAQAEKVRAGIIDKACAFICPRCHCGDTLIDGAHLTISGPSNVWERCLAEDFRCALAAQEGKP